MISDNRESFFRSISPFIYLIIRNALIKTNIQSLASAVLITIRDIECPVSTGSRMEPKFTIMLHYFDRELERMRVDAREGGK